MKIETFQKAQNIAYRIEDLKIDIERINEIELSDQLTDEQDEKIKSFIKLVYSERLDELKDEFEKL